MLSISLDYFATLAILLPHDERASFWSMEWSWEPSVVAPLALMLGLYIAGALRRGSLYMLRWRHASFLLGWGTLTLAIISPLHQLGEQLFSAHMFQHEVLILVSAPLISAAHTGPTFLWALRPRHRANIGAWVYTVEHSSAFQFISRPLTAWLLEASALWIWHVPALYQATLDSDWIHAAQHLSFFLTAVLFWSALYGVGRSAMRYGAATFYVFGTAVHCSALGALLTFSAVLWYPIYTNTTMRWGLTPIQDQQLGGVIMWVPSGVVFLLVGLVLFSRWLRESDRRLHHSSLNTSLRTHQAEPE